LLLKADISNRARRRIVAWCDARRARRIRRIEHDSLTTPLTPERSLEGPGRAAIRRPPPRGHPPGCAARRRSPTNRGPGLRRYAPRHPRRSGPPGATPPARSPECADAVLHHRQALSFTRHPGLCVQEVDRNACPPRVRSRRRPYVVGVRPTVAPALSAMCAESRDADLGRNPPLSRERTPQQAAVTTMSVAVRAPHRSSGLRFTSHQGQPTLVALFSP